MNKLHDLGNRLELIPFDLDEIQNSQGEKRRENINSFGRQLQEWGFISVKVANLKPIIEKAYEIAKDYFRLTEEEKMRRDKEMQSWEGYQTFASENLGSLGNEKPLVEHKEAYLFSGKSRKFPQQFGDTLSIYHDKMGELANRILNFLQEYFNIENPEDNQFDSNCAEATTRLTYYHPLDEEKMNDPNITWCGGHYDSSPFALLPKATASGLQLKRKGKWINIDVPDDTIILNTGRLFKFFTANLIKPRYHRVIADENSSLTGRYSIIFFPCWPPNFKVRPMQSCLKLATQWMDQEEKIQFQKEFLIGTVAEIMPIYDAIAGNIKVAKDQIKEWKEKYPDNPQINARWPDLDNIE